MVQPEILGRISKLEKEPYILIEMLVALVV